MRACARADSPVPQPPTNYQRNAAASLQTVLINKIAKESKAQHEEKVAIDKYMEAKARLDRHQEEEQAIHISGRCLIPGGKFDLLRIWRNKTHVTFAYPPPPRARPPLGTRLYKARQGVLIDRITELENEAAVLRDKIEATNLQREKVREEQEMEEVKKDEEIMILKAKMNEMAEARVSVSVAVAVCVCARSCSGGEVWG